MPELARLFQGMVIASLAVLAPAGHARDAREDVARLLARAEDPDELRRALVLVGSEAIPHLFQVLVAGRVPSHWRSDADYVFSIDQQHRGVIRSALDKMPRADLTAFLKALAEGEATLAQRITGIRLMGEIGRQRELVLLVSLATLPEIEERAQVAPRSLRQAFEAALDQYLRRGTIGLTHFAPLLDLVPENLVSSAVRVLAAAQEDEASRVLGDLLGTRRGLDGLLLAEITRRGPTGNPLVDADVRDAVRRTLGEARDELLGIAAHAAGVLRDDQSVSLLVERLSGASPGTLVNVCAALERITSLRHGTDAEAWRRWHSEAMRWWDEEAPTLLLTLEKGEGVAFSQAVTEALKRRLFHERIAASLVLRLRDSDPKVVVKACVGLAQIDAPFVLDDLVGVLANPHHGARMAAWKALVRRTGRDDLPAERPAWEEAFPGEFRHSD